MALNTWCKAALLSWLNSWNMWLELVNTLSSYAGMEMKLSSTAVMSMVGGWSKGYSDQASTILCSQKLKKIKTIMFSRYRNQLLAFSFSLVSECKFVVHLLSMEKLVMCKFPLALFHFLPPLPIVLSFLLFFVLVFSFLVELYLCD